MRDVSKFLISPDQTMRDAIECIERNAKGIALVVDGDQRLTGTITDGDVRKAVLPGLSLDTPVGELLKRKAASKYPVPITAPAHSTESELLHLMHEKTIRQLPLVDDRGRVVDLVTLDDLLPETELPVHALIMAGGFGSRMRPLTNELPKPMLPVGDRPLMEHIVEQLRETGIHRVNVSTHYLPDKIVEHFGDGTDYGVEIDYVNEEQPLGTAGVLRLLEDQDQPLLVVNGDILTRVDFRAMVRFHRKHDAQMTVGVRRYGVKVPYGVVDCRDIDVEAIREKPNLTFFVNAGIYVIEPEALKLVPETDERFDMTDLIECLLRERRRVVSFGVVEYWLDIGQIQDYERAQQDVKTGLKQTGPTEP